MNLFYHLIFDENHYTGGLLAKLFGMNARCYDGKNKKLALTLSLSLPSLYIYICNALWIPNRFCRRLGGGSDGLFGRRDYRSVSGLIQFADMPSVCVCVCCACPRLLVLNGRKLDCEMTSNYAFGTRLGALSLAHGPSFSLSVSPIFVLPGFQFFSTWAKTPQALLRRLVTWASSSDRRRLRDCLLQLPFIFQGGSPFKLADRPADIGWRQIPIPFKQYRGARYPDLSDHLLYTGNASSITTETRSYLYRNRSASSRTSCGAINRGENELYYCGVFFWVLLSFFFC